MKATRLSQSFSSQRVSISSDYEKQKNKSLTKIFFLVACLFSILSSLTFIYKSFKSDYPSLYELTQETYPNEKQGLLSLPEASYMSKSDREYLGSCIDYKQENHNSKVDLRTNITLEQLISYHYSFVNQNQNSLQNYALMLHPKYAQFNLEDNHKLFLEYSNSFQPFKSEIRISSLPKRISNLDVLLLKIKSIVSLDSDQADNKINPEAIYSSHLFSRIPPFSVQKGVTILRISFTKFFSPVSWRLQFSLVSTDIIIKNQISLTLRVDRCILDHFMINPNQKVISTKSEKLWLKRNLSNSRCQMPLLELDLQITSNLALHEKFLLNK